MTHFKVTPDCFRMGKVVASRRSSTYLTGSSSSTLDPEKSETKGKACTSQHFSGKEVSILVQLVGKFKAARRDQWEKFSVQPSAQGKALNFAWNFRDGQTCRNRFDKLISKEQPTTSTEVSDFAEP